MPGNFSSVIQQGEKTYGWRPSWEEKKEDDGDGEENEEEEKVEEKEGWMV